MILLLVYQPFTAPGKATGGRGVLGSFGLNNDAILLRAWPPSNDRRLVLRDSIPSATRGSRVVPGRWRFSHGCRTPPRGLSEQRPPPGDCRSSAPSRGLSEQRPPPGDCRSSAPPPGDCAFAGVACVSPLVSIKLPFGKSRQWKSFLKNQNYKLYLIR